jgi:hypothetical protein
MAARRFALACNVIFAVVADAVILLHVDHAHQQWPRETE